MSISDVVCTCGYAAKPERDSMGNALPCMRCWFDNDGSTEFMRGYNAGRAAGYAEAKEQAAKACAARHDINRDKLKAWAQGGNDRMETSCVARMNEDDALLTIINSLAPATTKEPT